MKVVCVIPARLESTRLPGKLMLSETGKPLIQHTYERAVSTGIFEEVVVATAPTPVTSELDIIAWANLNKVPLVITPSGRPVIVNGSERVAWAVEKQFQDADLVVGWQADEPEVSSEAIGKLVAGMMERRRNYPLGTLLRREPLTWEEVFDRDIVRADISGPLSQLDTKSRLPSFSFIQVSGFSRGSTELKGSHPGGHAHIGIYAWQKGAVQAYRRMTDSVNERSQDLEQLRAIDNGWPCLGVVVDHEGRGINRRSDYDAFVARWLAKNGVTIIADPPT